MIEEKLFALKHPTGEFAVEIDVLWKRYNIVEAMKDLAKTLGDELDSHEDIDFGRDTGLYEMEKKFRLITELLGLAKK